MRSQILDKKYNGYVTLTSVVVLSMVALVAISSLLLINTSIQKAQNIDRLSNDAYFAAEACAELALNELQQNANYAAGATIQFGDTSCTVSQINGSGNTNRTVRVTGQNSEATIRIEVVVSQILPTIIVTEWREVSSF